MSVIVKNMEMPKSCMVCPVYSMSEHWCDAMNRNLTHAISESTRRAEWCPLVRVPPHGRLIDEAAAIETTWMILRGLGYLKGENPQLEQTVRKVFATVPAIEVE